MNKKVMVLIVIGIFFLSLVNLVSAADKIGTFEPNEEFQIKNFCASSDCTFMNLTEIQYPNGTIIYPNVEMTKNGQNFNYTWASDALGSHTFITLSNPNGELLSEDDFFIINPTGSDFTTAQGFLYSFILVLIGMFLFFSINGIKKASSGSWLVGYISLTYILIYALIGICYLLAGNYLWASPIVANILYIVWFIMGIGFLPFVIILSLYILGQEAKATLEQDYLKQGYTKEEAKELSHKNKR